MTRLLVYIRNQTKCNLYCHLVDKFDHNITNRSQILLWAHGQIIGQYNPTIPPAAAGYESDLVTDFYQPLELKYHGVNRGQWSDNLLNPRPVVSNSNCTIQRPCDDGGGVCYSARWGYYGSNEDKIFFELSTTDGSERYVAVGFSNDKFMANSDIITGFVHDGKAKVQDRYATGHIMPVEDDDGSQINDQCGFTDGNKVVVGFSRTVQTTDSEDLAINEALFFLFAWSNVANPATNEISYHETRRFFSDSRIDPTQCTLTGKDDSGRY